MDIAGEVSLWGWVWQRVLSPMSLFCSRNSITGCFSLTASRTNESLKAAAHQTAHEDEVTFASSG